MAWASTGEDYAWALWTEGDGFEPPVLLMGRLLSRQLPLTGSLPPLQ